MAGGVPAARLAPLSAVSPHDPLGLWGDRRGGAGEKQHANLPAVLEMKEGSFSNTKGSHFFTPFLSQSAPQSHLNSSRQHNKQKIRILLPTNVERGVCG